MPGQKSRNDQEAVSPKKIYDKYDKGEWSQADELIPLVLRTSDESINDIQTDEQECPIVDVLRLLFTPFPEEVGDFTRSLEKRLQIITSLFQGERDAQACKNLKILLSIIALGSRNDHNNINVMGNTVGSSSEGVMERWAALNKTISGAFGYFISGPSSDVTLKSVLQYAVNRVQEQSTAQIKEMSTKKEKSAATSWLPAFKQSNAAGADLVETYGKRMKDPRYLTVLKANIESSESEEKNSPLIAEILLPSSGSETVGRTSDDPSILIEREPTKENFYQALSWSSDDKERVIHYFEHDSQLFKKIMTIYVGDNPNALDALMERINRKKVTLVRPRGNWFSSSNEVEITINNKTVTFKFPEKMKDRTTAWLNNNIENHNTYTHGAIIAANPLTSAAPRHTVFSRRETDDESAQGNKDNVFTGDASKNNEEIGL